MNDNLAREIESRNQAEHSRLAGLYPETCSHPAQFTSIEYIVYKPGEGEEHSKGANADWTFTLDYLIRPMGGTFNTPEWYDRLEQREKATSVRLCATCYALVPSEYQRQQRLRYHINSETAAEVEPTALQEVRDRVEAGEAVYLCPECNEFKDQEDLVQVRECPHCEESFNGTEEGRNCPSCNRPFSRLVAEDGCSDCLSENTPELVTLVLLDSMAVEKEE